MNKRRYKGKYNYFLPYNTLIISANREFDIVIGRFEVSFLLVVAVKFTCFFRKETIIIKFPNKTIYKYITFYISDVIDYYFIDTLYLLITERAKYIVFFKQSFLIQKCVCDAV